MSNYYFPRSWNYNSNTNDSKEFNSSDFNYNYSFVMIGDLLSYANVARINVFSNINYFTDIFVNSINGLSKDVFQYLLNIHQDVQEFMDIESNKTTKLNYNNGVTSINDNFYVDRLSCPYTINTNKLISDTIVANTIKCKNVIYENNEVVGIYIYYNNNTIPLKRSNLCTSLGIGGNFTFTINSNFMIKIVDSSNNCIYQFDNNTDDFIYNKIVNLNLPYKINVYYNYIQL